MECEDRRAQLSRGVVIPGEIFHGCLVRRITLDCGIQSPIVCGAGIHSPGVVVEVMPVGATEEFVNCQIVAHQGQAGIDDLIRGRAG